VIRKHNGLIADGEKILVVWIGDQSSPSIPLSQSLIQSKALTLFKSTKAEGGEEAAEEESAASRGGFMRFKETRKCQVKQHALVEKLQQVRQKVQLGSLGKAAAKQTLRGDAAAVSGEKRSSGTVLAREEKPAPGFRRSRDRLTSLLGATAAGDLKLKPENS